MRTKHRNGLILMGLGALCVVLALGLTVYNDNESNQAGQAANTALAELQDIIQVAGVPAGTSAPSLILPSPPGEEASGTDGTGQGDETVPTETTPVPPLPTAAVDGHDYVGYIELPALRLRLPVMKLVYLEDLQISPCLQQGSPYADDAVIAAHNYPSHFGNLIQLERGEEVRFTDMAGQTISYTVASRETIQPDQPEQVLKSGHDLVLYTCTKGGKSRVTVFCDRTREAEPQG